MGTEGGLRLRAVHWQPGDPGELGLISVGSLLQLHFDSRQQGLTVCPCVPSPVLGAVGAIWGVLCLFQEIQFMSTM